MKLNKVLAFAFAALVALGGQTVQAQSFPFYEVALGQRYHCC